MQLAKSLHVLRCMSMLGDVRTKLAAELGAYLASVNAQMPIRKESGAAVSFPGE